jgi:hypothetical protein
LTKQRFHDSRRAVRLAGALRIISREHFAAASGAAAGPRLQVLEIGAHAADLSVNLTALRRRVGAEKQEFLVVAAELLRVSRRTINLRALPLGSRLVLRALARPRSILNGMSQPIAVRVDRSGGGGKPQGDRRSERGESDRRAPFPENSLDFLHKTSGPADARRSSS